MTHFHVGGRAVLKGAFHFPSGVQWCMSEDGGWLSMVAFSAWVCYSDLAWLGDGRGKWPFNNSHATYP